MLVDRSAYPRRKVERTTLGQAKRGYADDGTQAAHIFSFGLANAILTHTPGRPLGEQGRREFIRDMNDDANLRIKSQHGNVVLDERRDARIAHAYVSGEAIRGHSTAQRAYQAYRSASNYTSMDALTAAMGEMRVMNPETGRSHLLRNHGKYV